MAGAMDETDVPIRNRVIGSRSFVPSIRLRRIFIRVAQPGGFRGVDAVDQIKGHCLRRRFVFRLEARHRHFGLLVNVLNVREPALAR